MCIANIYTSLDRDMVLQQLCRWNSSYKETIADFIRLNFNFFHKETTNLLFEPPFGE